MSIQTADAASISHLHRARALRGLIEKEADNTESSGTVTAEVIQALRDAELFWVLCPKELGGAGESVLAYFDTIEEAKDFLTTITHLGERDEEPMR